MEKVFDSLEDPSIARLDDMLNFDDIILDWLNLIENFLDPCEKRNLELHVKKSDLFS